MKKIADLTAFLVGLDLVAAENIESFVDDQKFAPSGAVVNLKTEMSDSAVVIARQTYSALFYIERWPHKEHPVELLFAQVAAWLMENDSGRDEIATPSTDVEILDDDTADIEIRIDFEEDILGVEDPQGPIQLSGKHYRLSDPVIDFVEDPDSDVRADNEG